MPASRSPRVRPPAPQNKSATRKGSLTFVLVQKERFCSSSDQTETRKTDSHSLFTDFELGS
jgi:hypothetical protein